MKTKWFFMLMSIAVCGFMSCSDNDDNESIVVDDNDDRSPDDYILSPEKLPDCVAKNFIHNVCMTEMDSTTLELTSWEVDYGNVLYAATPSVRYQREVSREDAREEFLSMIYHDAIIDSTQVNGTMTVNMGSHGYVKYVAEEQNGEWGHIDVNLKELPGLTRIVFSKPEAWPENVSGNNECGISKYDVFKGQCDGHTVYYTCIMNSETKGYGYLVAFDTWTELPTVPAKHVYRSRNCYDEYDQPSNIKEDVIECMRGFLYNPDGQRFSSAERVLKYIDGHQEMIGSTLSESLYQETVFFKGGNECPSIKEISPWYRKGHWHWIKTPYIVMTKTTVKSKMICYECDCVDPNAFSSDNKSHMHDSDSKNSSWGDSDAFRKYGTHWIWKFKEWYSYQRLILIKYKGNVSYETVMKTYGLTQMNV